MSFPILALAAVIVSAGIYVVDRADARAAWLLAFLILLTIAFKYPSFGGELTKLLGSTSAPPSNQQSGSEPANQTATSNVIALNGQANF
jgi:hypothetical protein